MIVINFKNYKTGKEVLDLAKKIENTHSKNVIAAVPTVNIKEISEKTKLNVYAQHVDYQNSERSTGFVTPTSIKKSGVRGTLLNHSEHKIKLEDVKKTIEECKKLNLKVIAIASDLTESREIKKFKPFAIAFEDPKLVATGKSITKYKTEELKKFVSLLKNTKIIPLCGAGIKSGEDYREALKLGCKGVLISSVITRKTPKIFLNEVSGI